MNSIKQQWPIDKSNSSRINFGGMNMPQNPIQGLNDIQMHQIALYMTGLLRDVKGKSNEEKNQIAKDWWNGIKTLKIPDDGTNIIIHIKYFLSKSQGRINKFGQTLARAAKHTAGTLIGDEPEQRTFELVGGTGEKRSIPETKITPKAMNTKVIISGDLGLWLDMSLTQTLEYCSLGFGVYKNLTLEERYVFIAIFMLGLDSITQITSWINMYFGTNLKQHNTIKRKNVIYSAIKNTYPQESSDTMLMLKIKSAFRGFMSLNNLEIGGLGQSLDEIEEIMSGIAGENLRFGVEFDSKNILNYCKEGCEIYSKLTSVERRQVFIMTFVFGLKTSKQIGKTLSRNFGIDLGIHAITIKKRHIIKNIKELYPDKTQIDLYKIQLSFKKYLTEKGLYEKISSLNFEEIESILSQIAEKDLSKITKKYNKKHNKVNGRRFSRLDRGKGKEATILDPNHPAIIEKRPLFQNPNTIRTPEYGDMLFTSGAHNEKLGKKVLVGELKGAPIFHLTLAERTTCTTNCQLYFNCYGNNMHLAKRWKPVQTPEGIKKFYEIIETNLAQIQKDRDSKNGKRNNNHNGFLIRLHTLGDFCPNGDTNDTTYVKMREKWLDMFPGLHIFGFTQFQLGTPIGDEIDRLRKKNWKRFAVRTSNSYNSKSMAANYILDFPATIRTDNGIVCKEQRKANESCGSCGLCWNSDINIVFIDHGKIGKGDRYEN